VKKILVAAVALAALSAAPAFAMEGTFQPTATASGFSGGAAAKRVGTNPQYNMGEGSTETAGQAGAFRLRVPGNRTPQTTFSYNTGGNG
jgi:hypothetical protein